MRKMKKRLLTVCLTLLAGMSAAFMVSCKDKGVKISFDVNGGEGIKSVTLKGGASYELPTPTREGYSFDGWYLTEDFSGSPVTSIVADKKATYYAKWEKLYLITLNLDGGTLAQTSLYLKAGANVYDFMKAYTPAKAGYEFGAWFIGESELTANTRMTTDGLTLTAKYKVGYTVEIYEQNLNRDGYTKRAEDVTGYAYAGKPFTSEQTLTGFREVVKDETVSYKAAISENASENVFVHYFDREEYTVTFHSNPPEGSDSEDEWKSKIVLYGNFVNAPYDYTLEGYCLVGWATTPSGKIVYESNYVDYALFDKTDGDVEPVKISPERDMALYAVWKKGYTDMFGNYDYLYLVDKTVVDEQTQETTTVQEIYLSRGDKFFKGDYDAETKEFYFEHNGETLLEGFLKDNGKFVYKNTERADVASTRFVFGKGLEEKEKINFDAYDKITYTKTDAEGINAVSKGTFYISDEGYYVATFTEGELAGQTLTMLVGYVRNNSTGKYDHAFQIQNRNEVEIGTLASFAVYNNALTYYIDNNRQPTNTLTLNGFGTATFDYGSGKEAYSYVLSEDEKTLHLYDSSSGSLIMTAKIMDDEASGLKGYMVYNEDLDREYSVTGGKLTLDGVCNAILEKDDETKVTAYYSAATSLLGGTLVSFQDGNGKLYRYMITVTKTTLGGGFTQIATSIDEKHENYSEYYYKDNEGLYKAPMLVLNDKVQNDALLYGYTSSGTYKLVSKGTYTKDETTNLYTYTASEYFDEDVSTNLLDISKVQTMIFAVDTKTTGYSIHYWYSYTTEDGTIDNRKEYTSQDGTDTLLLVSGIAVYKKDGAIVASGLCTTKNGVTTLTATDGKSYYFELNEETKKLEVLLYAPYELRLLESNGNDYSTAYKLVFDGKGGVSYVVTTGTGNEATTTTCVGTISEVGQTVQDAFKIYHFHADATDAYAAVDFDYIEAADGSGKRMFAKYNEKYNGEYTSEKDGKLTLDGFGYYATYFVEGKTLTSKYFLDDGNVVRLMAGDYGYFYFDLNPGEKTFTLRGAEFGTYIYANNQELTELLFELDGYGKLKVYTMVKDEENSTDTQTKYKEQYIDENGTYVINAEDETVELLYTENGTAKSKVGTFGYYSYNSSTTYKIFIEHNGEIQATYVNASDYSVLTLDGYGNATKYVGQGKKEYGSYTIVSDFLLYYVNQAGTDACVYVYNTEKGSIVRQTVASRGYYTANLESLLFTEYGFAVFGGKTTYYYYLNEQGNVTIYRRAKASDTQVNVYGFVEENFGPFDATKDYGGRTYYASNGFTIPFGRNTASESKYPVEDWGTLADITFTPTGDGEFTVSGQAMFVNGDKITTKACVVTRKVNEDSSVELYVTCEFYRFDITVEYSGNFDEATAHNTFTVNKLSKEIIAPSNNFWFMYMFYSYFGGSAAANSLKNTYGEVAIIAEYDVTGAETNMYFKATFGESSKMYDADGNLVADWADLTLYDHEGNAIESIADVKLSSDKLYKVSKKVGSYNYHLYFQVYESPYVSGVYGYTAYAFVREETLQTADKAYTVCMERVIVSDARLSVGRPFKVELTQGEGAEATTITGDLWYENGDYFYIVEYTKDTDKKITAAKYYKLKLAKDTSDQVGEGEDESETEKSNNPLPVYIELQSVEVETAKTLYASDGISYIDVITDSTGKQTVMLICIKGDTGSTTYIVKESSYDEATKTYTIQLSDTLSYTARLSEDGTTVTIEKVKQVATRSSD